MRPWILTLIACAPLCAGTAPAQAPKQAPTPTPTQAPAPPEVPAAVNQRYEKLVEEWNTASANYERMAVEARAQRKALPAGPHKEFAPRFVELARAGHPGAASWCLQFQISTSDSAAERLEIFLACEKLLVPYALAAEDPGRPLTWWPGVFGIPELVRTIGSASSTIGKGKASALCAELFDKVSQPESKALVLEMQVGIEMQGAGSKGEPSAEALALLRRLSKEFEKTESGQRAAGQLFRFENLQVGKPLPEIDALDLDDKPVKLADYRGKVIVLQFWGLWNHECSHAVPDTRELVERLKDKPFAWIGIDTDTNKDDFKKSAMALGINWRNTWQGSQNGPLSGALPRAWGISNVPVTFVCDAKGVIRYVGLHGDAIAHAVDTLLAELAAGEGKH